MPLTLANKITIFRILCVPVFILLITYYNMSVKDANPQEILRWSAAILFFCTMFLDAVDGYIARTRGQITRLGTIIDPLADKALLISSLVVLSKSPEGAFIVSIPVWYLLIVISRDALLLIGAVIIHVTCGNVVVQPRICGKATTFFQIILISWILAGLSPVVFPHLIRITSAMVLYSAARYTLDGIKQLEKI